MKEVQLRTALTNLAEFEELIKNNDDLCGAAKKFPQHSKALIEIVLKNRDQFKRLIGTTSELYRAEKQFSKHQDEIVVNFALNSNTNGILRDLVRSKRSTAIMLLLSYKLSLEDLNARPNEIRENSYGLYIRKQDPILHEAVQFDCRLEVIETLLRNGCDPNLRDEEGKTALHRATFYSRQDTQVMNALINHNAMIDAVDDKGNTVLHLAVYFQAIRQVEFLLSHKADPLAKNFAGDTAIDIAIERRDLTLTLLLEPLSVAAYGQDEMGRSKFFSELVKNSFTDAINTFFPDKYTAVTQDEYGFSPIHVAARDEGREGFLETLLPKIRREDLELETKDGLTALAIAVLTRNTSAAMLLLKYHANPNIFGFDKTTPLFITIIEDASPLAEDFLKFGANPCLVDARGNTPLHVFAEKGRNGAYGFKFWNSLAVPEVINMRNKEGNTALHLAVVHTHFCVFEKLLETNADYGIKNNDQKSVIDLLRECRDPFYSERFMEVLQPKIKDREKGVAIAPSLFSRGLNQRQADSTQEKTFVSCKALNPK